MQADTRPTTRSSGVPADRREGSGAGRRLRLVAVEAVLCAALAASVLVARDQTSGWLLARAALAAAEGRSPSVDLQQAVAACGRRCPPYALIDAGGAYATIAARTAGPERRRNADRARGLLQRALEDAPFSGRAWAQSAFTDSLEPDAPEAVIGRKIAVSYAAAPFLPDRNHWRTRWASKHWRALDPPLRTRVLDEAAWLQTLLVERGGAADGALGSSPAATALALREARGGR